MKMIDDRCFGECMGYPVCCIYMIMRISTGQKYIGQTIKLDRRNYQHSMGFDSSHGNIDATIKKYGWDDFIVQILEITPLDQHILDEREKFWIAYYNTYKNPYHYNLTPGGKSLGWGENHPAFKGIYRIVLDQILKDKQRYKLINPKSQVIKTSYDFQELKKLKYELENNIITEKDIIKDRVILIRHHIDDVIKMYNEGCSLKDISQKYNCQYQTVSKILKENGISVKRRVDVWNCEEEICNLYLNKNKSIFSIAKKYNCSRDLIKNILKNNNINLNKYN